MKKSKPINFLKEDKKEENLFKCTVIILICLLVFQIYTNVKSINNLEEEISNMNDIGETAVISEVENKKVTLIEDTSKVYELLGTSNVDRLSVQSNKVSIEGTCKNLEVLEELKSMEKVKNFSINSIENKNNKFYFQVVYEIGGLE